MADRDNQQPIELFVDQQVFIDVVRGNEQVDEFAAHTEVTAFERRGSELYLEGNILFTAYLDAGAQRPKGGNQGVSADGQPQADVEHLQHRMPFDLSVPVPAQSTGMFSVQVQVPEATVDVLGPGWLHIRALLQVEGLPQDGGYAAHCGAQEVVVPASPDGMADVSAFDFWGAGQHAGSQSDGDQSALQPQSDGGESTDDRPSGATEPESYDYSDLLAPFSVAEPSAPPARDTFAPTGSLADHQNAEPPAQALDAARDSAPAEDGEAESSLSESGWKHELQGADRALHGVGRPPLETAAPGNARDAQTQAAEAEQARTAAAAAQGQAQGQAQETMAETVQKAAQEAQRRSQAGLPPFRTGRPPQQESAPGISAARTPVDADAADDGSPHLSYHFEHTRLDSAESPDARDADAADAPGVDPGSWQAGHTAHTQTGRGDADASARSPWETDDMIPMPPLADVPPGPLRAESPAPPLPPPPQQPKRPAPSTGVAHSHPDTVDVAAHVSVETHQETFETVAPVDPSGAMQMSYAAVPEEQVEMSAAEWFWKTMDIPTGEATFTMKFRIVQIAETVEDIANYYNVGVAELMRANELSLDASVEGSLLYIPLVRS
ncbi:MAG: hypothetical protein ACYCVB_05445 [Bacilli bacterium]